MIIYYLVVPCGYSSINAGTCTCRWDRTYTWWKITHPWNNIQWSACTQTKISSFPGDQFTPEVIELVHWPNHHIYKPQIIVEKWDYMHELRFWSYICQMLQDQFYPWFTHKRYVAHLTLKKCGSGASSQKWSTTDHSVHKIYMYTMALSIISNSHVRSAKIPPSTNFYLLKNWNSYGVVFSLEVEDYIVSDWYCCYISTMQQGENILPVSYQVLQQHP